MMIKNIYPIEWSILDYGYKLKLHPHKSSGNTVKTMFDKNETDESTRQNSLKRVLHSL